MAHFFPTSRAIKFNDSLHFIAKWSYYIKRNFERSRYPNTTSDWKLALKFFRTNFFSLENATGSNQNQLFALVVGSINSIINYCWTIIIIGHNHNLLFFNIHLNHENWFFRMTLLKNFFIDAPIHFLQTGHTSFSKNMIDVTLLSYRRMKRFSCTWPKISISIDLEYISSNWIHVKAKLATFQLSGKILFLGSLHFIEQFCPIVHQRNNYILSFTIHNSIFSWIFNIMNEPELKMCFTQNSNRHLQSIIYCEWK